MFQNYGYEVASIFKSAENIRKSLRHPYVGTEHLLLALLKKDGKVSSIFKKYQITYDNFQRELCKIVGHASHMQEINLYTPMLKKVIELANLVAEDTNNGLVTPSLLAVSLLEENDGIAMQILFTMKVPIESLYIDLKEKEEIKGNKKNLEIMKIGFSLNDHVSDKETIIGREKEINQMIETLLRHQKNNPLLIGASGVGKTAIVEELARRIKYQKVPSLLKDFEIISLDMGSLVAGTKYRGEFEERLNKIMKEVVNHSNIILFIDEIHAMVNAGGAEGAISASDILKPYLARGTIKLIGATTTEEYHQYIEKDKALERRFEVIKVEEPTNKEMFQIGLAILPNYERYYHISLTHNNLKDLIRYSEEYLYQRSNPDRTIDLLDSVCARIVMKETKETTTLEDLKKLKKKYYLEGNYQKALEIAQKIESLKQKITIRKMTLEDIIKVIEQKTNSSIIIDKTHLYSKIEDALKKNIIGQDQAISKIMDTLKENKLKSTNFLLIGGSGVGKTETVKIISQTLKTELLRIDMSEYNTEESVSKLIGANPGYVGYEDSYVFQKIKDHPYTTLLFDEIEKAHPKVLNLLLQILDESFITDHHGDKIRFDHTLIFLTSNAVKKNKIGFDDNQNGGIKDILSKELLGRMDTIVFYDSITKEVATTYIRKHLHDKTVNDNQLIEESNIYEFGLRKLKHNIYKYNQKACTKV